MRRAISFWGLVLIAIGVLLLLSELGYVNFWAVLGPLVLLTLGLFILWQAFLGPRQREVEELALPLEGATQASVRIQHGAGRLRVTSGAGPGELLAGSFSGGVECHTRRNGDVLEVDLRVGVNAFPVAFPWRWGPSGGFEWTLRLNGEVPISLRLETGAGENRLDLSGVRVTDLLVQTGASSTDITLPAAAGFTRVKVQAGAASIVLRVPEGVAASIHAQGGLAGIRINRDRFKRARGVYRSEDYETAANKVEIDAEMGVGSVEVL